MVSRDVSYVGLYGTRKKKNWFGDRLIVACKNIGIEVVEELFLVRSREVTYVDLYRTRKEITCFGDRFIVVCKNIDSEVVEGLVFG